MIQALIRRIFNIKHHPEPQPDDLTWRKLQENCTHMQSLAAQLPDSDNKKSLLASLQRQADVLKRNNA